MNFPITNTGYVYGDQEAILALDNSGIKPEGAIEKLGTAVQPIERLGEIYVTVNPSTVPADALKDLVITLNKTNGEQVLGVLQEIDKEDEHVKYLGYTRANNNGFYKIKVGVVAADVPTINLNLDDNLKAAAKDFVKSPSKSDLLGLAEAIYKQFNNRIPALGLKFEVPVAQSFTYKATPWSQKPGGLLLPNITVDPTTGKYSTLNNDITPSGTPGAEGDVTVDEGKLLTRVIMSPYDIAAVTYHPLSYSFDPEGYVPDRRLPQIGHIQDIANRVLDKFDLEFNLNADDYNISLKDAKFEIDGKNAKIKIDLNGLKVFDGATEVGVINDPNAVIELGYQGNVEGGYGNALDGLLDAIVEAVGTADDKDSFVGQLQAQVNTELQKLVNNINSQIKTQITDKISNVKEEINNELNGRLGDGVNRLIDLYNKIAQKVNAILDDPNAYMQVYAAYRDGDGDLHHFSTVKADPSIFTKGTGDAITMFLTSYNGELLAPAYKKYVAVLDKDGKPVEAANAAPYLNKVLDGRQQKTYIPVNALTPGEVYQVVYTALDYRGNVSARSFYIQVAK